MRLLTRSMATATLLTALGLSATASDAPVQYRTRQIRLGRQSFNCRVVLIDLPSGRVQPRLIPALGGIGRTEPFAAMVRRSHAAAAINGSFFEAYRPVGDKEPGMTLISGGQVIHKGALGSVIGFTTRRALIDRLDLPIRGRAEPPGGRPFPWYAYWINRAPTSPNNVVIFTPARGARSRTVDGVCVVVENDIVTRVATGDVGIPGTGYVIHFRGEEARAAARFMVGTRVTYEVGLIPKSGASDWNRVIEAVGAGPRLVTQGVVTVDPVQEGFQDPKILTQRGLRSAIGIRRDGVLMLVSVPGSTIRELAEILRALGAHDAMNLDGGASSGLYANGTLLVQPDRELSNALVFAVRASASR